MFEFMKGRSVNQYHLPERFGDCVPNLLSFNYITPMAICLEAMLKLDYLIFAEEKHIRCSIDDLEYGRRDDEESYTLGHLLNKVKFTDWLQNKYEIKQSVVGQLKAINEQNNYFKHSLLRVRKMNNPVQKKYLVKAFYEYSAKYYEQRSDNNQAPPWPNEEYEKLVASERENVISRGEPIRKGEI